MIRRVTSATLLALVSVAPPAARAANANAGAALVQTNGCAGCHGATLQGGIGPRLAGIEHRLPAERIAAAIAQPVAPMPKFPFTAGQIADIVAYLSSLDAATSPVATVRFPKSGLTAVVRVRFPGPPPKRVTAVPAMPMGSSTMRGSAVTLHPVGDGHVWQGTIAFSMSGAWTLDVDYDGRHLTVPVNVAGTH